MTQPEQSAPENPAPQPTADTVGSLLRNQRLALGRDIAFVAEHLRIRAAYIRAIEEGRYMDLPGSTYAIGFIRSYAEFLGLDQAETVRRFKEESAGGLHNKPELFFPSPVSEGRIPGGAILFLGLILAGSAYGAWYYMSSRDVSIAEMVPALPERLQSLIGMGGGKPSEPAAETAKAETAKAEPAKPEAKVEVAAKSEPPAAVQPAKIEMPPPAKPAAAGAIPAATPPAPAATPALTPPATQQAALPAAKPAEPPKPAEAAKPAEPPKPAEPAKPGAAAPTAAPAAPATPAAPARPVEQAVPPDEEEEAPKPVRAASAPAVPTEFPQPTEGAKTYGAYNTDSRITVRSRDTVWVEVRDANNKKIWAQTLRKGDVYRVPNNPSYTMLTGSAGGIDVFVDGKQAPSLGQMGTVRRGIQLDPEKLMAGQ